MHSSALAFARQRDKKNQQKETKRTRDFPSPITIFVSSSRLFACLVGQLLTHDLRLLTSYLLPAARLPVTRSNSPVATRRFCGYNFAPKMFAPSISCRAQPNAQRTPGSPPVNSRLPTFNRADNSLTCQDNVTPKAFGVLRCSSCSSSSASLRPCWC